jgi:hypothetical protein
VTPPPAAALIWRAAPHFRIGFGLLGVAVIFLGVVAESTDPGDSNLWRVAAVAFGAALVVWPHLVRVELHHQHVLLKGVVRTRVIPLSDLAEVEAGESGLVFVRRDRGTALGSALIGAKAPLASWLGRRARGDDMAEQVMAAANRFR